MKKLAELSAHLKAHLRYYRALYQDSRTPWMARLLLWLAIGYTLLPFDLIPDFIPVIGHFDNLVIVPGLLWMAVRLIPESVKEAHKHLLQIQNT